MSLPLEDTRQADSLVHALLHMVRALEDSGKVTSDDIIRGLICAALVESVGNERYDYFTEQVRLAVESLKVFQLPCEPKP